MKRIGNNWQQLTLFDQQIPLVGPLTACEWSKKSCKIKIFSRLHNKYHIKKAFISPNTELYRVFNKQIKDAIRAPKFSFLSLGEPRLKVGSS
jgi:hypothetical protein